MHDGPRQRSNFIGQLSQTNWTLCQEEDHQNSWEEDFWQDHQKVVKDFQEVRVHQEEDFPMRDQEEEETPDKDQTSWWKIHLKCSQEYKQKLSTSLLNGSFMSALTSPTDHCKLLPEEHAFPHFHPRSRGVGMGVCHE